MNHPGETCEKSGVYCAYHYQHRLPHAVMITEGARFPMCRKCGDKVKFEQLVHSQDEAAPIVTDSDFSSLATGGDDDVLPPPSLKTS